ncbi:MAG TPA: VOC family protein [Chloroflexota bacterium]
MLKALTPNLMVENVRETVDWYHSVLGFEAQTEVPGDDEVVFAIVRRDGVTLMFQSRTSLGSDLPSLRDLPIGASQTFYIEVDNVEELRRLVEGKARILKDLHDTFYGTREFYFTDRNGYVLSFAQTMAQEAGGNNGEKDA